MSKHVFNIVFTINEKFAHFLPVFLSSIMRNTTSDVNFYVLHSGLSDNATKKINTVVSFYKQASFSVFFKQVNILDILKTQGLGDLKPWFGSYDVYTRIFLPQLLEDFNIHDPILLFDVDMIALKDISEIYDEIENVKYIAGLRSDAAFYLSNKAIPKEKHPKEYIQLGTLAMNLAGLKEIGFSEKCLSTFKTYRNHLLFPEQDAFNLSVDDANKSFLSHRFNVSNAVNSTFDPLQLNTVILHYCGNKPWNWKKPWTHTTFMWHVENWIVKSILKGKQPQISKITVRLFFIEFISRPFFIIFNSVMTGHRRFKHFLKPLKIRYLDKKQ